MSPMYFAARFEQLHCFLKNNAIKKFHFLRVYASTRTHFFLFYGVIYTISGAKSISNEECFDQIQVRHLSLTFFLIVRRPLWLPLRLIQASAPLCLSASAAVQTVGAQASYLLGVGRSLIVALSARWRISHYHDVETQNNVTIALNKKGVNRPLKKPHLFSSSSSLRSFFLFQTIPRNFLVTEILDIKVPVFYKCFFF